MFAGKWPRSLHAQLVDGLVQANAKVIAFDLRFDAPRGEDDEKLGRAIGRSRRVVVVEFLKREEFSVGGSTASKVPARTAAPKPDVSK